MITPARWCELERQGRDARRRLPWDEQIKPRPPHGLSPGEATAFQHGWQREDSTLADLARSGLLDSTPAWAG